MNGFIKVLIVEDDLNMSFVLKEYLNDCGMKAKSTKSGEQALKKKLDFDIVLVDLRLPGMDGEKFIKKANEKNKNLKFIIITGALDYEISEQIKDKKFVSDKVFKKPISHLKNLKDEIYKIINYFDEK